jgi:shikimate kinase
MSIGRPDSPPANATRHVVFVGLMGAGKSTVGRRLADVLGVAFVDNDDRLRASTKRSARELQEERGRAELHAAELRVLRDALADPVPSVVTAAASTADTEAGQSLLAAAHVVWLAVEHNQSDALPPSESHRPPRATGAANENARRIETFRALADVIVNDDRPPEEIVAALTTWARDALRQ